MSRAAMGIFWIAIAGIASAAAGPEAPVSYGSWMSRPPGEWPPITMINHIEYTDGTHPTAACGFLLDTGDDVLAATAKHVLRFFKSGSMDSVSFGGTLKRWSLSPKNAPDEVVVIERLVNEDASEPLGKIPSTEDWLLFTVRERSMAVQPLRLRNDPLRKGETVYVVGWRYTDEGRQRVFEGRYVRRDKGSVLISVPGLADNKIPGLSGAPVLDSAGYVIGIMSTKAGKLERLAPVDYPRAVLEK